MIFKKFVCLKEGFRQVNNQDAETKNERAQTRIGCGQFMSIKISKDSERWIIISSDLQRNHPFIEGHIPYMLPSQRSISEAQSVEIEIAEDSSRSLKNAYELMGREARGQESLSFTKVNHKNQLRTRRESGLACGEASSILTYLHKQSCRNPSFFSEVQMDKEDQITNILWADARMVMDYGHFGDLVSFDTTYELNRESRPFGVFVGFNNHREVVVFGGALMYDEITKSFVWLFQTFLEAMSNKHPQTIFTDQDVAIARAIALVMPNIFHRLCK